MRWLQPLLEYRRDGPLYGLVFGYLCQVHGFVELTSRGLALQFIGRTPADREAFVRGLEGKNAEGARRVLSAGITALLQEPQLASLVSEPVKVNVAELAAALFKEYEPALQNYNLQSAGSLVVLAWEHTEAYHTEDPVWEFLRHLRNAVAHGGRFHFLGPEPRRQARWREREITKALAGTPLFAAPVASGFLGIGDILHLLADIDRDLSTPADT